MEVDATNLASAERGGSSLLPRDFPEAKRWQKLRGGLCAGPEYWRGASVSELDGQINHGCVGMRQSGRRVIDYMRWTTVSDLARFRCYLRTYEDSSIGMVDLTRFNLGARELKVGGELRCYPRVP